MENNYNNGYIGNTEEVIVEAQKTVVKQSKIETKKSKLIAKMQEAKRKLELEQKAAKERFEKEEADLKAALEKEIETENKKMVIEIRKFWESGNDFSALEEILIKVIGERS